MESRRLFIAITLCLVVFFGFQFLFPPKPQPPAVHADSTAVQPKAGTAGVTSPTGAAASSAAKPANAVNGVAPTGDSTKAGAAAPAVVAETTVVAPTAAHSDSGATFEMTNIGAAPASVIMNTYPSRVGGHNGAKVRLGFGSESVLKYELVTNNGQPVDLSGTAFQTSRTGNTVSLTPRTLLVRRSDSITTYFRTASSRT